MAIKNKTKDVKPTVDEVVEVVIEETITKEVKKEKKEKEVVIEPVSMKESFAKQIEKTPFVLYQNGLTICRWKQNVRITLHDDTFEMNGNHYKYSGVEIHHI